MALIKCPECGKKISNNATSCPNCGCPIIDRQEQSEHVTASKHEGGGCLKPFITFLVISAIIGFAAAIQHKNQPEDIKVTQETEVETTEFEITEDSKKTALETDEQIWGYVLPVINANNDLMAFIERDSVTLLDIYNTTKDFEEFCRNTWNNPPQVTGYGAEEYLSSCRDYILYEQTLANSLLKYADSGKTSDLSEAQKNMQSCKQALSIVASNRGVFLSINGFSQDEIQEIANDLGIQE